MSNATKAQKCKYCDEAATLSLIWADGRAYIPVCRAHERTARNKIASQNDSVSDVVRVEPGPVAYHEAKQPWMGPTWDTVQYAKTLPRFEFIMHFVARMTRLKKNQALVGDMQLKWGRSGWYYTVGGLKASNPTKDANKVYDMIRRTQLWYYVKQAEELRIAAHESAGPYREHQFNPHARMEAALEPALAFVEEEEAGTYFGLQADDTRTLSAFQEAPAEPPPRARIGRRGTPRGAVIPTHSGPDMQGVKAGQPIAKSTAGGRMGKGTAGDPRRVKLPSGKRREIPDSLLQMLGSDWKQMRAYRVHDNRMTINIDGVRYSVYTRRG